MRVGVLLMKRNERAEALAGTYEKFNTTHDIIDKEKGIKLME